jgi:hypothetical protein
MPMLETDHAAVAARFDGRHHRAAVAGMPDRSTLHHIAPLMHASHTQSRLLSLSILVATLRVAAILVVRVLLGGREQGLRVAM